LDSNKVIWTLELIEKLKAAKIGDESRLNVIKNALENGKSVYSDDKKYLQEQFKILQERGEQQMQTSAAKSDEKRLYIISKLQEAEIGNNVRLETMKETIQAEESISAEDDAYLDEKYEQLKKVDDSEVKVQQKLEMIERLKHSEIGLSEKLDECKNALNECGKLTEENESYLQEKIEQYNKIHRPKPATPAPPPRKKIVKKRARPVDPDAKYCAFCQRMVHPERDFSVGALVVLLFLGIIPGLLYYALKSKTCPICKHHQWQIPPDEE
jgi:hypothetical protein